MFPRIGKHGFDQIEQFAGRCKLFKDGLKLAFDIRTADRLAVTLTALLEAHVVRVTCSSFAL
ncbi:MAG: hypothetical protein AAGK23_03910 [Pseudomonadota bacterium]